MSNYLFISDAAKEVKVESHVLRYWEEELHLPIKRNELGHRYYTKEDVERFKTIKGMKERGLQLKAIKMILKDGKLDLLPGQQESLKQDAVQPQDAARIVGTETVQEQPAGREFAGQAQTMDQALMGKARTAGPASMEQEPIGQVQPRFSVGLAADTSGTDMPVTGIVQAGDGVLTAESKEEKSKRLQWLLQQLIRETLQENNEELCREIKDSVVKELDYQFRMQEEREELRDKMMQERDEEHYKRMDELLRKKAKKGFGLGKKKKGIS